MRAEDLDTPALYVDLDVLERNIRSMQDRCRGWKVGLRPHVKTHKIQEIARMQLAAGAVGIAVAKVGEAEVMPGDDVLIGYPVLPGKAARIREILESRRIMVALDSVESAKASKGIPALVEVDVGVGRCGVQDPRQLVRVARACSDFRGLFYWPSWLDDEDFRKAERKIAACLVARKESGLEARIVSGGSTPGASFFFNDTATTEIRPGTYVFNDGNCVVAGCAREEDCALRVLVAVVSTAVPGQCIVDGGSKTFSSDATRGASTFGLFPGRPWAMAQMNEEHGYVRTGERPAKVGEKAWAIPGHVCPCVNLHDEVHYGRDGRVEGAWKVAARGRVR